SKPMRGYVKACILCLSIGCLLQPATVLAADWPQFMRVSERTGDAAEETVSLPLGLAIQVRLADPVTTSPAVVAGRGFVVDQMGTCYCIDSRAGKILWKNRPDGDQAKGSNTPSACVVKGRVYFGTTAGTFHILNAADGKVVKSLRLGWPIIGSPTAANES